MDFREIFYLLKRRWFFIVGFSVVFCLGTVAILAQLEPIYKAETQVLLHGGKEKVINIQDVPTEFKLDPSRVESEIQLIKSRPLVLKVVRHLDLDTDPEFTPESQSYGSATSSSGEQNSSWPKSWIQELGFVRNGVVVSEEESLRERVAVENLLRKLTVLPVGNSFVISIAFKSKDPQKAAAIANAVADFYLADQLSAKMNVTRQAKEWLNSRLAKLRAVVQENEQEIENYREQHPLLRSMDDGILPQQISELNSQLLLAQADRTAAETRSQHVQALLASANDIESVSEILGHDFVSSLRAQETQLSGRISELSVSYGERHPKMLQARQEMEDFRQNISAEVAKVVRGLTHEVEIARARESVLSRNLKALEEQVAEAQKARIKLRELKTRAAADHKLYQTFLVRYKEVSEQEETGRPDAGVVSRADIPLSPTFPRLGISAALAFAVSVLLCVTFLAFSEGFNRRIRTGRDVRSVLGVNCVGLVPEAPRFLSSRFDPLSYNAKNPRSAFSEAIRNLRTSILFARTHQRPKKVLVTSSLPQEGKSTVAMALAASAYQSGIKTVLVDCDLRRPCLHQLFRSEKNVGVSDVVLEGLPVSDVIQTEETLGMPYIGAGSYVDDPLHVLSADAMRTMLDELAESFDLVVLDSPPVLVGSDARVLADQVDKLFFVVRWDSTTWDKVELSAEMLDLARHELAEAVLSRVNVRKHAKYGYPDSGQYSGALQKYYAT